MVKGERAPQTEGHIEHKTSRVGKVGRLVRFDSNQIIKSRGQTHDNNSIHNLAEDPDAYVIHIDSIKQLPFLPSFLPSLLSLEFNWDNERRISFTYRRHVIEC